jgi:excisionase family DNA binding protein
MLEDIRRGIVDCVVVKDLSRFGREYIDSGKYIERLFPALGVRFFRNIDILSGILHKQEEKLRPVLNGERYITDYELAEQLKLTRRTLAEYRINGKLPYYKIGGKLLYKEKDILALLERNRVEAFDDR